MPETRPVYLPPDPLTPERDITHHHFRPGEHVVILKGAAGGELWGDAMKVVADSWHTPTDEDGWRLLDPNGGDRSYITAHPRYLVHLSKRCPECLMHQKALREYLVKRLGDDDEAVDCSWYSLTALNQLVHVADARPGR
ncbi:hypothetical protein GCM10010215_25860 [Streptomyces virginiae]|uniref:Uncharacterized protein n=1 Tax=Streptomyces virginiae TaxID=1961 RepID=A0ABQ3NN88_STRVG|nr:hypothetical protein [Streptomyces virginiae]MBP2341891.1 hypothetical protein [Streptomyces virginiae]GGP98972.1 hypothetical protein GCM10010215_25860 [Streptomyces virginiae]GHI14235.1 hypothetical protein Scinn_36980 [Streptomyces virginiae]